MNVNDIEVIDFIEFPLIDIQEAEKTLSKHGFYTDNLWHVDDVMLDYHCTEEQAMDILKKVFNSESTCDHIRQLIRIEAQSINLKKKE